MEARSTRRGAAALFSLLASCRLRGIEPTRYLGEVLHILRFWPRERFLDLSSLRWTATRTGPDLAELERRIGTITAPAVV